MLVRRRILGAASVLATSACIAAADGASGDAAPASSPRSVPPTACANGGIDSGTCDEAGVVAGADEVVVTAKDGGAGFAGAYASPTIVRDGSTYHAYFAKESIGGKIYNVPHANFSEDGTFTLVGDSLPKLGARAVATGRYPVWAPAAAKIDAMHWMLYYTAQLEGTPSKKCIWRAHSANANGPFVDDYDGPVVCLDGTLWAIDPYLVSDARGAWYLAARLDEPDGINTIKVRALDGTAASFAPGSSWTELVRNSSTSWEQPVLENAAVVHLAPPKGGTARWFVFYSGGAWSDDSYAVGYADCGASITGPCTKQTPNGPWLATDAKAGVFGPGTPTFYTDAAGRTLMSVQAWQHSGGKANVKNQGQIMRTYHVTIDDAGVPAATPLRVDL